MKKTFIAVGASFLLLIVLSTTMLLQYTRIAPEIARLQLVSSPTAGFKEPPSTIHSRWFTPTPTVVPKKKVVIQTQTPQPTKTVVTSAAFPPCNSEPGWYYGWHGSTFEYGTDFDCPFRTPQPAIWGGTIMEFERTCWNSNCSSTSGGLVVILAVIPGLGTEATYYLHLDELNYRLHIGDYVAKGTLIGWTGGQVGYGNWPTSPWFTSGPHEEIGFDWPYAKIHTPGINCNPLSYIERAIQGI